MQTRECGCCDARVPVTGEGERSLDGRDACSAACLLRTLRARLLREIKTSHAESPAEHAYRVPLGLLLLSRGCISAGQLESALISQREAGSGRIGEWLRREAGVSAEMITRALAEQWGCPVLDLKEYRAQLTSIPRELIEQYRLIPLPSPARGIIYLASDRRVEPAVSYAVQHMTGMRAQPVAVSEDAFSDARAKAVQVHAPAAGGSTVVQSKEDMLQAAETLVHGREAANLRVAKIRGCVWMSISDEQASESCQDISAVHHFYRLAFATPHCMWEL